MVTNPTDSEKNKKRRRIKNRNKTQKDNKITIKKNKK
jgi:hypothetical protein